MRYMQVIEASDADAAQRSYLELLERRRAALQPGMAIYVETVHRPQYSRGSWLCYAAPAAAAA